MSGTMMDLGDTQLTGSIHGPAYRQIIIGASRQPEETGNFSSTGFVSSGVRQQTADQGLRAITNFPSCELVMIGD